MAAERRIVLYHRVADLAVGTVAKGTVTASMYRKHLRYARLLGRSFQPLGVGDSTSRRSLSMTFDDGYCDLLDHAVPELSRRNIPAVFYVVSGRTRDEWNDWDDQPKHDLFQPTHWRELADLGLEIGSHTIQHARLTRCDDHELRRQLVDSKKRIEDAIGRRVVHFAYPWGDHDDRVVRAVRDAGYETACTIERRPMRSNDDPFRLPRYVISHRTGSRKWVFRVLRG